MPFIQLSQVLIDDIDKWLPIDRLYVKYSEMMSRGQVDMSRWEYRYQYPTVSGFPNCFSVSTPYFDFWFDNQDMVKGEPNRVWFQEIYIDGNRIYGDVATKLMFSYSPRVDDIFLTCFQIIRYHGYHTRTISQAILDLFPKPSLED